MSKVVLREGDLVYVQENDNEMTVTLAVDWLNLARQKAILLGLLPAHPLLEGLVQMIDYIQDVALESGLPVVTAYPAKDWSGKQQ